MLQEIAKIYENENESLEKINKAELFDFLWWQVGILRNRIIEDSYLSL